MRSVIAGLPGCAESTGCARAWREQTNEPAHPAADQPKQALTAAFAALRDGQADWLLLRRGDRFTLSGALTWGKSGPAADNAGWMRLGAYGDDADPRPMLDSGDGPALIISPGFQSTRSLRNLAFTDIHFLASARMADPAAATTSPMAIQTVAASWQGSGHAFSHLLFENVLIQGYGLGYAGNDDLEDPRFRRSIFHYIFSPDGVGGAQGWIGTPDGGLLEDNIFYQIQSDDIPGVVTEAYYITAHSTNVVTRGNIVIKATEALMQRPGGLYHRNVGVESLLLNAFDQPFYLGNTRSGTVRDNLFLRDEDGAADVNLTLVPGNDTGQGVNIGVHDTQFSGNVLSGSIAWNAQDATSFSDLTFDANRENVGTVATRIGDYLTSIGRPAGTADDWGQWLITRDRANFSVAFTSVSIINYYRARVGMAALPQ